MFAWRATSFYNECASPERTWVHERNVQERMTKHAYTLLLPAILLTGCPVPQDQNVPNPAPLIKDPITQRDYRFYISSKYDPTRPAPVIISLHGTPPWDTAGRQMGEWKKIAEDHGAILICPKLLSSDGILPADGETMTSQLLRDERFVLTILGELHYKFSIDRQNVFLTSWSGGGYPLWFIGLRHPDVFTALCARQSTFRRRTVHDWYPESARDIPVLIFHGTSDVVPVVRQSKQAYEYLRANGFRNVRLTTTPGGHRRFPEVAMQFFLQNWGRGP